MNAGSRAGKGRERQWLGRDTVDELMVEHRGNGGQRVSDEQCQCDKRRLAMWPPSPEQEDWLSSVLSRIANCRVGILRNFPPGIPPSDLDCFPYPPIPTPSAPHLILQALLPARGSPKVDESGAEIIKRSPSNLTRLPNARVLISEKNVPFDSVNTVTTSLSYSKATSATRSEAPCLSGNI